ncbi:transglycosylase domain-containing protein [Streptomyces albus]|uniref:transglycosylase domain-containing protein n=1 Tax=Streptomyces albus TaxID=1888 RepID=UPI003F515C86
MSDEPKRDTEGREPESDGPPGKNPPHKDARPRGAAPKNGPERGKGTPDDARGGNTGDTPGGTPGERDTPAARGTSGKGGDAGKSGSTDKSGGTSKSGSSGESGGTGKNGPADKSGPAAEGASGTEGTPAKGTAAPGGSGAKGRGGKTGAPTGSATPAEGTPKGTAPGDTPARPASSKGAAARKSAGDSGSPATGTPPVPGAPGKGAPTGAAPGKGAPDSGTPAKGTPDSGVPGKATPAKGVPAGGAPTGKVPAGGAPTGGGPAKGGPAGGGPGAEETALLQQAGGLSDGPGAERTPPPDGKGKKKGREKREKRRRTGWRRLLPTWRMVLGGVLLIVLLVSGALVAGYLLVSIPAPNKAAAAQTNVFLYADGTQIARDGDVNREIVPLSKVPKKAQHAVLAAEDRDFYHESAVDPQAMLRAGWNMLTGGERQSGSTITQQYVKNYYLSQDQTVTRKAKEFFIALKLDNEVGKNDILAGYLNTSYFGRNAYGIQSAAHAYYGKDVGDLTTAESAYLAALVNSPNAYDTRVHPENKGRAVARWNYVLDGMVTKGWLSKSERQGLKFPEPEAPKPPRNMSGERGYLVEAVKNHLIENKIIDERRLRAGGFRITTTFQPKKQKAMRDAVNDELMSQLDKKNRKIDKYVRAGGTSVDPKTGKVVAMYGGIGYTEQYTNSATSREYQVGSTFKPFVFTSALQNKATTQDGRPIKLNTVYDGTNRREVVSNGQGTGYAPANEDQRSYGRIPVTTAMDKSVNSVFAQMGIDVGPKKVKKTATDLGVPAAGTQMPEDGSISLGVATASTLDMAEAYATLANHGKHGHYTMVEKITRGGEVVKLPDRDVKQAVPRAAADTTTAALRSVVEGGTGQAAKAAGRPAAGKTGTAEEDKAAWFAGFTPDLSTVISVMGKDPKDGAQKPLYGAGGQARVNGGGFPAQIWGAYTKAALEGRPVKKFDLDTSGNGSVPSSEAPDPSDTASAPPSSEGPSDSPSQSQQPSDDPPSSHEPPPSQEPTSDPPSPPGNGGADGGLPGGTPGGNGDPGGGPGGNGDPGGIGGDPGNAWDSGTSEH